MRIRATATSLGMAVGPVLGLATAAVGQTPSFDFVGFATGGNASVVRALSIDGVVATGGTGFPNFTIGPGFTWTRAGGRYDFGLEPGMPAFTIPRALSSGGGVLAGTTLASQGASSRAFRWTGAGLPEDLGVLPGHHSSEARGISGDGSVVVGFNMAGPNGSHQTGQAFRWTQQTGMQPLPHLRPVTSRTEAFGISRDGTTIVGSSQAGGVGGGPVEAFRWTQAGGMVALPGLPGAPPTAWTRALAVSADGSVVVGKADDALNDGHAVRWTAAGIEDLGVVPGYLESVANAVSDDGTVVAGLSYSGGDFIASVWTPATGMVALAQHLASAGVVVPSGWALVEAHAVSGDGLTFAGEARSSAGVRQGFVATVPAPSGSFLVFGSALFLMRRRRAS